jgi:hypothetical protein
MATVDEALALVDVLSRELDKRRGAIRANIASYRGDHPLAFASPEFQGYFNERFEGFSDNWCAPVIQATTERMNYVAIELGTDRQPDLDLMRVWKSNDCERGSSEAWVLMLAAARVFALVWGNAADERTPRITWEHPENFIIGYDADTGQPASALKLWQDGDFTNATLYLPDQVWKFTKRTNNTAMASLVIIGTYRGGWDKRQPSGDDTWPLPNPIGEVPAVEFRNQTLLDGKPISDISGVAAMQSAINLVWAYLLNGLDYATLPQRVVTGADIPKVPVLDADGQVVGHRPVDLNSLIGERVLWLPNKEASTSE